jgi:hypothetical protein
MDGLWSEGERFVIESRLSIAVIGGPDTVQRTLSHLLKDTAANELIFTSDVYEHVIR